MIAKSKVKVDRITAVCYYNKRSNKRGVAQFGSALGSGPR